MEEEKRKYESEVVVGNRGSEEVRKKTKGDGISRNQKRVSESVRVMSHPPPPHHISLSRFSYAISSSLLSHPLIIISRFSDVGQWG